MSKKKSRARHITGLGISAKSISDPTVSEKDKAEARAIILTLWSDGQSIGKLSQQEVDDCLNHLESGERRKVLELVENRLQEKRRPDGSILQKGNFWKLHNEALHQYRGRWSLYVQPKHPDGSFGLFVRRDLGLFFCP